MKKPSLLLVPALLALAVAGCRSQSDEPAPAPAPVSSSAGPSGPSKPMDKSADKPKPVAEAPKAEAPKASDPAIAAPMADGIVKAKVGELAPNFALKDLDGKEHTLAGHKGKTVVMEWFSPGCPTCQYAYGDGSLKTMPEEYIKNGIVWLSVNSEAPENKAASAEMNKQFVEKFGLKAPLLMDPTGVVARSYLAKTTPHMFVIDPKGVLVYQGALDNAPMGKAADGADVIDYVGDAVADVKAGRAVKTSVTKPYG